MPPLRLYPDPVLRERSARVNDVEESVRRLVRNLIQELQRLPNGVGLAAPQIGVLRCTFVFDIGDGPQAMVNPVIERFAGVEDRFEGCLSIPGLYYPVSRPASVALMGLDEHGNRVRFDLDGLAAHVVQHEIDHLDGVLFIDRLDPTLRAEAFQRLRDGMLRAAS